MNLTVASSPHIRGNFRTNRIMLDVMLALAPALTAGVALHGLKSLLVVLCSVAVCVGCEWLYGVLTRGRSTVVDGSAAVTGLLLGMTLPATVPFWLVTVGGAFAILFVKCLCGGLGQNIFNPALSARGLMMLVAPVHMVRFEDLDGVTAATPLHHMVMPALPEESIGEMLLGLRAGSIGEGCAILLLLGGCYLVYRRVITIRIPAAYLATVAVLTLVFHRGQEPLLWMAYSLLGGGVLLGAIFMATDYATSPVTPRGQVLYGIGCGVLTVLLRYFGIFPEGVTYAILIMNALTWIIDKNCAPVRFGKKKGGEKK